MQISIVIPTHNRKFFLEKLLHQLENQDITNINLRIEIVVVVDGSEDGTIKMINEEFESVHVVKGDGTWWFTKSVNMGFKYVLNNINSNLILTLNDDIEIPTDYLKTLYQDYIDSKEPCIIGTLTLSIKKPCRIVGSGIKRIIKWRGKLVPYHSFMAPISNEELKGIHPSVVLPGRGMLVPLFLIKELKLFDEVFKQYGSDYDFCLRARKLGYNCYISWNTATYSHVNVTGKSSSYIKKSIGDIIRSYFDPTSRTYLFSNALYIWRHGYKLFWPLRFTIFLIASFRANLIKRKIS